MTKHSPFLLNGLFAGLIAITVNTLVLKAAPLLHIMAESGGLLKLVIIHLKPFAGASTIAFFQTTPFWIFFHYLTGFTMIFLYMYLLEPVLPGKALLSGTLFSFFPWLINGLIVLPMLGQGVFGVHKLPLSGMVYFFFANWLFAVLFVYLYERFRTKASVNNIK